MKAIVRLEGVNCCGHNKRTNYFSITTQNNENKSFLESENREMWLLVVTVTILQS